MWDRSSWNKGYCKAIRSYWYFVVAIPRNTLHAKIHHEIFRIPPPSGASAKDAYNTIVLLDKYGILSKDDPIDKRVAILISLFNYAEPETVIALKREESIIHEFYEGAPA